VPRLLLITERFPPDIGGLASSAERITKTLCQMGVEVDVMAWSRYLQPGEVLLPNLTPVDNTPCLYRVGLYRHWDMTMPHTLNILEWLYHSRNYTAIWGHYLFPSGFLATWFAKLNGIPSTVSARGNDIDRAMFPPGDFAHLQWTLSNANVVTTVSADMARKIQLLAQRDDVLILKNAVDGEVFSPATQKSDFRKSLGIAEDEIVLGFAGELREKKGQKFLLNALKKVNEQYPACLLIIGEVRTSEAAALQIYTLEHPELHVIVTGHLPHPTNVARHLQLCDFYLQPSLWDGMPNALLEAMACGCCCIASDAGGIPEAIAHGESGFLLPRSHLHRLGEAVLECLEQPAICRQIGMAARDRVLTDFSLEMEKLRLQTVINRLMPRF